MLKNHIPFCHAKSIYEIDISFYKKYHINTILCDLDNTLDSYKQKTPTEMAIKLRDSLLENNIELIIVSNNTGKRVKEYAEALNVRFFNSLGKPFPTKLKKILKENNIDPVKTIMIGDQTVTDIPCGNGANIKTILTDKIVVEDQPTTRFNRIFDKPIRKHLAKKNLLSEWSNK